MTNKVIKIIDKNRKLMAFILIALIIVITFLILYREFYGGKIVVDVLSLKSSVIAGEESINDIKIENTGSKSEKVLFNIIGDLKDLVIIEKEIELKSREERVFKVVFKSDNIGVFIGKLKIFYDKQVINIPIILEVQPKNVLFDSNINLFPFGGSYLRGDKITSEVKIFDLADIGRNNVKVFYYIKDFDGRTIVSDTENLIIDGKFEYSKTINLPENINLGSYVLITIVEYKNSVGTSSAVFNVVSEKKKDIDEIILWVFIIFGFLVILSIAFFIYFLFYRDKLLNELHNQYKLELKRQKEIIRLREKGDYKKLRTNEEKKVYKKVMRKIKVARFRSLKKVYKKRVKKFKEIKRKGNKDNLERQLRKWKTKGYDTDVLEKRFKFPNVHKIREKIKQWKTKGYDTSVLEKRL